ncbi:MAG: hypothetical protein HGGPFJEG_00326 [Ignavibacteria bacterium]|nr:hypothetical protein [Ignavibacteria bacterium]
MKDTKLIYTLKTFTKDDLKLFEKFVASPFFNKGRNYLPLLAELRKFHPEYENEILTYEYIYKKLYPGRKFNKQVMWNQVSEFEKLATEFLLQTGLKNNRVERFIILFNELSKRHLYKQVSKEIERIDKYNNTVGLGKEHFHNKWIIEGNKVEYWSSLVGRQDKSLDAMIKCTEYLIISLLAELSISVSDLQIMKNMYDVESEIESPIEFVKSLDLKKLIDTAKENNHKLAPVMNFYYNKIMCCLDENDENYFFEMKNFFDENSDSFDTTEQKNTIISLANYCAHKMRLGNSKFLKQLFEINKFRLAKELDTYGGNRIQKSLYYQIIRNALSLGEIEWTENFVKEYTSKLIKEQQKTMSSLAWGLIYYARKEYENSLQSVNKVEFIDLRDKLHVRILTAKTYYELSKSELLFYYIDSSKHFIGNNTAIESNTKEAYLKFFNYLNRLLIFKENPDSIKLNELHEDIEMDKALRKRHKEWLLEKVDEL